MADLRILLAVAAGGMLGCLARYGIGGLLTKDAFPWGTVTVNVVGSFALGFIVFSEMARGSLSAEARLFLTVGFLGGFTTMSSFAVELVGLTSEGDTGRALLYFGFNAIATVVAAFGGRALAFALG